MPWVGPTPSFEGTPMEAIRDVIAEVFEERDDYDHHARKRLLVYVALLVGHDIGAVAEFVGIKPNVVLDLNSEAKRQVNLYSRGAEGRGANGRDPIGSKAAASWLQVEVNMILARARVYASEAETRRPGLGWDHRPGSQSTGGKTARKDA